MSKGRKANYTFGSRERPASLGKGKLAGMDNGQFREWLVGVKVVASGNSIKLRFLENGEVEGFFENEKKGHRVVFNILEPGLVTFTYGTGGSWLAPTLIFASDLESATVHTKWSTRENVKVSKIEPKAIGSDMPSTAAQEVEIGLDLGDLKEIPIRKSIASIQALLLSPLGFENYAAETSKFSITVLKTEATDPATIRFNQSVGNMMSGAMKKSSACMRSDKEDGRAELKSN